jgi:hypothetical protein
MSNVSTRLRVFAILTLPVWLAGCGAGQPLHVASIQLGRSVNADHTVSSFTTAFTPDETVYLSVLTSGVGSGTIAVRWTYAGRVIDEPKKEVSYRIDAATEFRLQSPAGFPIGDYMAEVLLNGQSAGTRTFSVQKQR